VCCTNEKNCPSGERNTPHARDRQPSTAQAQAQQAQNPLCQAKPTGRKKEHEEQKEKQNSIWKIEIEHWEYCTGTTMEQGI